jgi:hypothetical protein
MIAVAIFVMAIIIALGRNARLISRLPLQTRCSFVIGHAARSASGLDVNQSSDAETMFIS